MADVLEGYYFMWLLKYNYMLPCCQKLIESIVCPSVLTRGSMLIV